MEGKSRQREQHVQREQYFQEMQVFLYDWSISAGGGVIGEEVSRAVLKDLVGYKEIGLSPVDQEAVKAFGEGSGVRVVNRSSCIKEITTPWPQCTGQTEGLKTGGR